MNYSLESSRKGKLINGNPRFHRGIPEFFGLLPKGRPGNLENLALARIPKKHPAFAGTPEETPDEIGGLQRNTLLSQGVQRRPRKSRGFRGGGIKWVNFPKLLL